MVKGKLGAKGFSLVELMVVVAIIGILAAVAIPNFQRFQRKARQSEATALLGGIHGAEAAFHGQWENYTTSLDTAGFVPDGTLRYVAGFAASVPFSSGAVPPDYTGPGASANFNTRLVCAAYPARCMFTAYGMTPANPSNVAAPAMLGNAATFQAGADGDIGGAATDVWTINNAKLLRNTTDGTM